MQCTVFLYHLSNLYLSSFRRDVYECRLKSLRLYRHPFLPSHHATILLFPFSTLLELVLLLSLAYFMSYANFSWLLRRKIPISVDTLENNRNKNLYTTVHPPAKGNLKFRQCGILHLISSAYFLSYKLTFYLTFFASFFF